MSQQALKKCGDPLASDAEVHTHVEALTARSPDRGLYLSQTSASASARAGDPGCGMPTVPATLFNAMIGPLSVLRVALFLWNQGETNADYPARYSRCSIEMINEWRDAFPRLSTPPRTLAAGAGAGAGTPTPFILTQIGPWPDQNSGIIARMRHAQATAEAAARRGGAAAEVATRLRDEAVHWRGAGRRRAALGGL